MGFCMVYILEASQSWLLVGCKMRLRDGYRGGGAVIWPHTNLEYHKIGPPPTPSQLTSAQEGEGGCQKISAPIQKNPVSAPDEVKCNKLLDALHVFKNFIFL